ncbi:MAG TPA: amidase family protein, partial [Patescibacteria group bacterium]|nr:amidase family protein [Patescibacteria group bacterium]
SSTDVMGCFAKSADDIALIESVMAGQDAKDMTTLPDYFAPLAEVPAGLKIGLVKEAMTDDVDPEVRKVTEQYAEKLRAAGHVVDEVSLPSVKHSLAIYYIVVPAEVSSNLARYDGVRFGRRAEGVQTLSELYGRSRDEGFVTENKRRIMIGSYVLSSGFFDAYYQQAQKARTVLINEFNSLFGQYDLLLMPTAPTPAFGIGENTEDPVKMYLSDVMTVPMSLAGLPAISAPAGASESGLPIGVQLVGPMKADALVIATAGQMERQNG